MQSEIRHSFCHCQGVLVGLMLSHYHQSISTGCSSTKTQSLGYGGWLVTQEQEEDADGDDDE